MFTLKEYATHRIAKNWRNILKVMTAKRAPFFPFWVYSHFLARQHVFSFFLPPMNTKNVTL